MLEAKFGDNPLDFTTFTKELKRIDLHKFRTKFGIDHKNILRQQKEVFKICTFTENRP